MFFEHGLTSPIKYYTTLELHYKHIDDNYKYMFREITENTVSCVFNTRGEDYKKCVASYPINKIKNKKNYFVR